MLLPSDVARLVLGYLQQENLISTCQTFILESSDLKEYAEHCTDEGFIPACLLSLFGKNLTTILNEYVAMKTKETSNNVPAIMSSLWKKLDHTLSQIRSMQSSPRFAGSQRARTRTGIAEIKRQRKLASQTAPASAELLTLPYLSGQFTTSPSTGTQVTRQSGQISNPSRSYFVVVNHSQSQDTVTTGEALNVIPGAQEKKAHASLMSPGRRKSESQRKSAILSGPHSTIRNFQDPNAFAVEKQMVIENAREKILSNKSLQEKLAENINKFLTSDNNIAQVPKQTDNHPTEPETSIDEFLGLPSEIHMSEEAIQDILEQTESDPAFQALFDLFDYGKTKNNKNVSQNISSQPMESNPNIVLADETNLAVKGSFETEESGSAIIIASPVQPVLQGMVGMIPVSVVGQNGNNFSSPPRQVLHMPLTAPVCSRSIPQFPVPPKSQKPQGLRNKPCIGKQANNLVDSSSRSVGCDAQRTEVSDKNIGTDLGKQSEETTVPFPEENIVPAAKPCHRRVLCFDSTTAPVGNTQGPNHKMVSQSKQRNAVSCPNLDSPGASSALKPPSKNAIKREKEKPPLPKILSKSESAVSRHTAVRETQSEKKVSPTEIVLESFHKATANKENELCSDVERQKNSENSKPSTGQQNGGLRTEKSIASLQELNKKQGTSSSSKNGLSVGTAVRDLKQEQTKSASSLITAEMLQEVQRHSSGSRLADTGDLAVPRTPGSGAGEKHKEEPVDVIKAPSSRRFGEDSSTSKVMVPPVTPDLPACSPASETGSENSVNMAAHTLMILSRAAISRTTSATPLKDNTQQFRGSSRSTTKKRKIEELDERERNSRTSSKNLTNSSIPMKKKKIKKKKLPSSFPAGMDVDKFLLSLHYDE
ncbi:protein NPAT isoform X7 [Callithrix jacchus]